MNEVEVTAERNATSDNDELLVEVLDGYLADLEAGRAAEPELLFARHPDLAPRLRACLAGLQLLGAESPRRPALPDSVELAGYSIVREAGRGGMGVVYEAVHKESKRRVALKLLPFAATLDSRQLQRFENEARAAAQLHHPHIVPVYDVCLDGPAHFYTMQFIDGISLAAVVREQRRKARLATRQTKERVADDTTASSKTAREQPQPLLNLSWNSPEYIAIVARLIEQAASALDHAHQIGIIHRDVKPGNLLIDQNGHLWIADFGLASVRGAPGVTRTGDLLGTIRYMSPEQVSAQRGVVDHRSDVYSLGVTLFELLTLQAPFAGSEEQEVLARMAHEEPRRPRRLQPSIPEPLETITLKAMAYSPADRYATAAALAEDIGRFLAGKPILARPPVTAVRIARWARRHRSWVAALSLAVLVALIGLTASTVVSYRALKSEAEQRALAESRELQSRRHLYAAHMHLALEDWHEGNMARVLELLDKERPQPGQTDLRKFEWNHLSFACQHASRGMLEGHHQPVVAVAAAANNSVWASADKSGLICIWDAVSHALRASISAGATIHGIALSSDARRLAAACDDKALRVWDTSTSALVRVLDNHESYVAATAFSSDGRFVASCSNNVVNLWDAKTFKRRVLPQGHDNQINCVAFSPDSTLLATAGNDRRVVLWDLEADEATPVVLGHHRVYCHCVAFSPDGRTLLSGSEDGMVQLWDLSKRKLLRSLRRHTGAVASAVFAPDGRCIASVSWDGSVRLWDADSDEIVLQQGHAGQVFAVAFAADGKSVLTGGDDGEVHIWDPHAASEPQVLAGHKGLIRSVAFSADGQMLASTGADHSVRLWNLRGDEQPPVLGHHEAWVMAAVFAGDGKRLITADLEGNLRQWELASGESQLLEPAGGKVWSMALTPDEKTLVGAGYITNNVLIWDTATGRKRETLRGHTDRVWSVAISPDGKSIASGSNDLTVRLWDAASGQCQAVIPVPASYVFTLAFSPDGQTLAVAGEDRRVRLWDARTRAEKPPLGQHPACVRCMAFFPDGQTLATGSDDGTVKLWDMATRQERATLRLHSASIWSLALSADGKSLAAGDSDGRIILWRSAP